MLLRLRALFQRSLSWGSGTLKIKTTGSKGQISVALILVMTVILGAMDSAPMAYCCISTGSSCRRASTVRRLLAPDTWEATQRPRRRQSPSRKPMQKEWYQGCWAVTIWRWQRRLRPRVPNYNICCDRQAHIATFFKLIGLSNGKVAATATAQMPQSPGCVNCSSAIATPGSQPTVIPGSVCSGVGQCNVLPIGLD